MIINNKTKKQLAVDLYKSIHTLPKDKIIRVFVKELNLPSENSARTYISGAKKELHRIGIITVDYKPRNIDYRKTKKGKAMMLFNSNLDMNRSQIIDLFIQELEMTESSAATHCSMCCQEYSGPKHNAI
jgi:hypothetical protein